MLKTRVITALILVAILLPALFYAPAPLWALLIALFIGVGGWEWGALLGWDKQQRVILGMATAVICLGLTLLDPAATGNGEFQPLRPWVLAFYGAASAFWVLLMPFWLRRKWAIRGLAGVVVGGVLLVPTWLAMVQLRAASPWLLLAVFALVWMADICAYFSGRAFGRHKLAPTISPGKTWEGAMGAVLGVMVYGFFVLSRVEVALPALPVLVLALLAVTAVSIVGDLFESLLKRKAGIKDSSNILPGHGGVLDRIDSLTSTLPVVAFLWLLLFHSGS